MQAFLSRDFQEALAQAEHADLTLPLGGIPIGIKDVINAASDPDGDGGDKVEKALAEYYGIKEDKPGEEGKAPLLVQTDEAGLYGLALA